MYRRAEQTAWINVDTRRPVAAAEAVETKSGAQRLDVVFKCSKKISYWRFVCSYIKY